MQYEVSVRNGPPEGDCVVLLSESEACFEVNPSYEGEAWFEVSIAFTDWHRENYVLMPACAYNGNRFHAVPRAYPPMFVEGEWLLNPPITITDVPRLSVNGPSCMEVTTGDLASPGVFLFDRVSHTAYLIRTTQGIGETNFGITFEEVDGQAILTISYPSRRRKWYRGNRLTDAWDAPLRVRGGERICIPYQVELLPCKDVRFLHRLVFERRNRMGAFTARSVAALSFSMGWRIQEEKYNRLNYRKEGGYYRVGTAETRYEDWQPGWVGGGMSSLALLAEGSPESVERARSTMDYLTRVQAPSGFFHGMVHRGIPYGDGFDYPGTGYFHLIRKSADTLYFLFKHIDLLMKRGEPVRNEWKRCAQKCADAFVDVWRTYAQWGQFVDVRTGEVMVGGSSAASMAPAALALAYQFFGNPAYIQAAEEGADFLYRRDLCQGVTTGGPGEILQCPDSESAFGLLESFVVLHEVTGAGRWLDCAEDAACQCSSWVVDYNYRFPEGSEFDRLGIRTTGSVFANVQNKHAAPGICTLSGNSLLKLYRATGKRAYLNLMGDIARFTLPCMSREERPVRSWDPVPEMLPPGRTSLRLSMGSKPFLMQRVHWLCKTHFPAK